jgi:succinate dehydrogenase/fumarate reductase flavoprotein subunit
MTTARFSPARAVAPHQVKAWDMETDVVIVGFGVAGASGAIAAAGTGARVTLFEVGGGSGGASGLSGGEMYLGGGTSVQKAAGFDDTPDAVYAYLMATGGPDADAAKTRLYADRSVEHFNWLVEQGVPYKGTFVPGKIVEPETDDTLIWSGSEEAWPFVEQSKPAPRSHTAQWQGWGGGRMVMDKLEAKARELGVDIHCNTRVLCLVGDEDGVLGVVARVDGVERYVRAKKGVVLCTGGFGMNQEMLKRYAPGVFKGGAPIGVVDDGSGILMGQSVGGDAIHMDQYFLTCPWYPPGNLVKGIMVNINGQRFINEDCYHGRVTRFAARQPGNKYYLLVDSEIFERPMEIFRIDIAATGETWAEVEGELGMTPGALTGTMDVFNREAAQGRDPLFHKAPQWLKPLTTPPYAAFEFNFETSLFSYFTLGGLNTRPTGEVLNRAGAVIPGLYAAGRVSCGVVRWGDGYSSGMSLGDSSFFGRIAGGTAGQRSV